jgi:hypothetical protein
MLARQREKLPQSCDAAQENAMRSRTFQAHVLGLVVLALTVMAAGEALADPAARDNWVSDDGKTSISKFKGEQWIMMWSNLAKNQAGVTALYVTKTTDTEKVLEQEQGKAKIKVTLGANEAVIVTDDAGPAAGKIKGSWK